MAENDGESETSAAVIIECNDGLDVSLATDFKFLLEKTASQNIPIVLDASKLVRIDAAALQLLCAFFIEAKKSGLDVSWNNPSEPLLYAAKLSGLNEILHL